MADLGGGGQQWTTMGNNKQQWATMDNNGQQWTTMDKNGHQWATISNNGQQSVVDERQKVKSRREREILKQFLPFREEKPQIG